MTIPQARLLSNGAGHSSRDKAHFCDGNHGMNATSALGSSAWWKVEIAMTMNFPAPRTGSVWREPRTEESLAHSIEDRELAHRWHEESKRRYEELAHQWLELAEQRLRCA